jgi:hypothetical protein
MTIFRHVIKKSKDLDMYSKKQLDDIDDSLDKVRDVRQVVASMSLNTDNKKFKESIEDILAYIDVMIQDMIEDILENKPKQ